MSAGSSRRRRVAVGEVVEIETDKILELARGTRIRRLASQGGREWTMWYAVAGLLGVVADSSVSDSEIDSFHHRVSGSRSCPGSELELSGPVPEVVVVQDQSLRYLKRGEGQEAVS